MSNVLANILRFRDSQGLTNEQLAEKLGVDRTLPGKWEAGKGYPSRNKFPAYAKAIGMTVAELTSDTKSENLTSVTNSNSAGRDVDDLKRELATANELIRTKEEVAQLLREKIKRLDGELATARGEKQSK